MEKLSKIEYVTYLKENENIPKNIISIKTIEELVSFSKDQDKKFIPMIIKELKKNWVTDLTEKTIINYLFNNLFEQNKVNYLNLWKNILKYQKMLDEQAWKYYNSAINEIITDLYKLKIVLLKEEHLLEHHYFS